MTKSSSITKASSESQNAYERPPFDPSIEDSHAYVNHTGRRIVLKWF
jgi:hypothetical protein